MACRVIVVGSGLAGSVSALSAAAALGPSAAQVLVLDKAHAPGGNSVAANSGINLLTPEQGDTPALFKADTMKSGGGLCRPELVDTLVAGSEGALRFLESAGVKTLGGSIFQTGGQSVKRTHSPPAGQPAVGAALMQALQRCMQQQGGNIQVRTGVKVTALIPQSDGAWQVAVSPAEQAEGGGEGGNAGASGGSSSGGQPSSATSPSRIMQGGAEGSTHELAHAVVLATGGYAASQELLGRYAPQYSGLGTTNGAFATGDGLELGQQAGAAAVDLEHVQLNPTGIVDPRDPGCKTKTVAPEKLRGLGAILLNLDGRRFVNELGTRDKVAGAILEQPHSQALLLLGSKTAADFGPALEPYLAQQLISRAGSVEQAAQQMGLPAERLQQEIAAYNRAAAAGADGFGKAAFPASIDPAQPLFWTRVTPVTHYCMGGLAINSAAEVLDRQGRPIPGLFAAGEVAGGVHGKNLLVGSSLLECVVFGRIAGQSAADYARQLVMAS